jgi:hypothetical protein
VINTIRLKVFEEESNVLDDLDPPQANEVLTTFHGLFRELLQTLGNLRNHELHKWLNLELLKGNEDFLKYLAVKYRVELPLDLAETDAKVFERIV